MEPVRISKLMAERGLCSRREADSYIERGWVLVDGRPVTTLGAKALPHQEITLSPAARQAQQSRVTIVLHKPVGYVSGQAEDGYRPAATLITPGTRWSGDTSGITWSAHHLRGLAPAGRLDIDSTGLLILTQDGRIARELIGADSTIDKEYLVRVQGKLIDNGLALLNHGLSLDGQPLKPAKVEWLNDDQLRFVLREGRKRQIRRMCELVGLKVVGLKRVRIGQVRLGQLPQGQWRYLGPNESLSLPPERHSRTATPPRKSAAANGKPLGSERSGGFTGKPHPSERSNAASGKPRRSDLSGSATSKSRFSERSSPATDKAYTPERSSSATSKLRSLERSGSPSGKARAQDNFRSTAGRPDSNRKPGPDRVGTTRTGTPRRPR